MKNSTKNRMNTFELTHPYGFFHTQNGRHIYDLLRPIRFRIMKMFLFCMCISLGKRENFYYSLRKYIVESCKQALEINFGQIDQ